VTAWRAGIEELHRLIAPVLIEKATRSTGGKDRFRRRSLGWSGVGKRKPVRSKAMVASSVEGAFDEVVSLIQTARQRAYQAVNTELVSLYWQIGQYISRKLAAAEWGEGVVDHLARHLARTLPGLRGFTRRNLFRMRQVFDTYARDEKVSPLVTQLPWTHNLIVLGQSKRPEEREFYLRMAIKERWSSRELERQIRLAAFERVVLSPPRVSAVLTQTHGEAAARVFKDAYVVEFLNLPVDSHVKPRVSDAARTMWRAAAG
jgi:predicted nuclease of restriction endonuclease-like (RecB) superfamily